MFGFKSKAQKMREREELRLQGIEAQREKEMQARISVKRTLASMKKQSTKLEAFKKEYIEKAREASLIGNQQTFRLSKAGLKLCLSKQKFLDSMIANFELATDAFCLTLIRLLLLSPVVKREVRTVFDPYKTLKGVRFYY